MTGYGGQVVRQVAGEGGVVSLHSRLLDTVESSQTGPVDQVGKHYEGLSLLQVEYQDCCYEGHSLHNSYIRLWYILVDVYLNPHQTEVSESLIRRRGGQMAPPLDIDQIMDFANSVFTGA